MGFTSSFFFLFVKHYFHNYSCDFFPEWCWIKGYGTEWLPDGILSKCLWLTCYLLPFTITILRLTIGYSITSFFHVRSSRWFAQIFIILHLLVFCFPLIHFLTSMYYFSDTGSFDKLLRVLYIVQSIFIITLVALCNSFLFFFSLIFKLYSISLSFHFHITYFTLTLHFSPLLSYYFFYFRTSNNYFRSLICAVL